MQCLNDMPVLEKILSYLQQRHSKLTLHHCKFHHVEDRKRKRED